VFVNIRICSSKLIGLPAPSAGVALAYHFIGLCCMDLKRFSQAARAHRYALMYSRQAPTRERVVMQFRALTNLGLTSLSRADAIAANEEEEQENDDADGGDDGENDVDGDNDDTGSDSVEEDWMQESDSSSSSSSSSSSPSRRDVALLNWKARYRMLSHHSDALNQPRCEFYANQVSIVLLCVLFSCVSQFLLNSLLVRVANP
jgi:hypothetical protein